MTARKRNMAGSIAFVHRGLCTVAGSSEKKAAKKKKRRRFLFLGFIRNYKKLETIQPESGEECMERDMSPADDGNFPLIASSLFRKTSI